MPSRLFTWLILTISAVVIGASATLAQNAASIPPIPQAFSPGFGDLMNTLVQPRHAKLGLAAREQNWALAGYAVHELKDALASIARSKPRFRNSSVAEMMEATTGEPIKALELAVHAADSRQFAEAYNRLTEGCNSCHAALNHGFIVIETPDQSSFANQDFRVEK